MTPLNPLTCIDFYKADHRRQYPAGTSMVYSNFTARSDRLSVVPKNLWTGRAVFFGLQAFCRSYLMRAFDEGFFRRDKASVLKAYQRRMDTSLGPGAIPVDHIAALHDLGYLPLAIKALPEGTLVPMRVPMLVIYNTHPDFFWLTNYLETALSACLWKPTNSATIALHYRLLVEHYARITGADRSLLDFQCHDFSARGMSGLEDAAVSGMGHLTSFVRTDSVSAIDAAEEIYGADADKELVGCSVPATEHSVMSMGSKENERETFARLITRLYPRGIISIVSDTWDFWKVITQYAASLKNEILARDGKVVFRPDSGDPVQVICGDPSEPAGSPANLGAVRCLWNTFGGTVNAEGYKTLDPHVGLIYGDSITLERCRAILEGMRRLGFASGNIVFGVGSYTYQHVTRDTLGMAVKSTYGEVRGEPRPIFKDPVTDNGVKKSARGLVCVRRVNGTLVCEDQQPTIDAPGCLLEPVFRDGRLVRTHTLREIRERIRSESVGLATPIVAGELAAANA